MAKRRIIADRPLPDGGFIPDLCQPTAVLAVVVGAQLLALLLVLAQPLPEQRFWPRLGLWSLAVQWVGLLGTAGLCAARPLLARVPVAASAVLAILWLLLIAAATTLAAVALDVLPDGTTPLPWLLARNLLLAGLVTAVVLRLLYLQYLHRQRERAHHQARLEVLQARMRPHFLFNSLNTIASLTVSDPARAEEVTLALADLLRVSLQAGDRLIPLGDELELCRRYLAMEQLRLGERLAVDWAAGEAPVDVPVPPLSLQPLLENAVFHGIEPLPGGGRITVQVLPTAAGGVEIHVANPLPAGGPSAGLHMALANLRARLAGHFGAAASLREGTEGDRHTVCLQLPSKPA